MTLPFELLRLIRQPAFRPHVARWRAARLSLRHASNLQSPATTQRNAATDYQSEEYSSPFAAVASIFGRIFRIAVYGSVAAVVSGLCVWQGTNLWIEYIAMGRALPLIQDDFAWEEDEQDAWSGNHAGGGTDKRLSFYSRLAIRSAYSAQLYSAGPLDIGKSGGHLIQNAREAMQVPDKGYLAAEQNLLYAISTAREQNIELPDRAIIELEQRLASVRERVAGKAYLLEARKGWERILKSLETVGHPAIGSWAQRETARAARKLGEISLRLANETMLKGAAQDLERRKAEDYLLRSVKTSMNHEVQDAGFNHLALALTTPEAVSTQPALARNLISTLTLLVALYASERSFSNALQLSEATLRLVQAKDVGTGTASSLSKTLHQAWLRSRVATLQAYEAEIRRAALEPETACLPLLSSAIAFAEGASIALLPSTANHSPLSALRTALFGNAKAKNDERLRARCLETDKDARVAASSAAYLSGLLQELGANSKTKGDWYQGDRKAAEHYLQALTYSAKLDEKAELTGELPVGRYVDQAGFRRAWNAYVRCVSLTKSLSQGQLESRIRERSKDV